jgi:hypothetical protein
MVGENERRLPHIFSMDKDTSHLSKKKTMTISLRLQKLHGLEIELFKIIMDLRVFLLG